MASVHLQQLQEQFPLIHDLQAHKEILWKNPYVQATSASLLTTNISKEHVQEASARLERFSPYIERVFPETSPSKGIIESPITAISHMKTALVECYQLDLPGELLLKHDHALPIAGSIKARGGIYEILKHAEMLAIQHGYMTIDDNYTKFAEPHFRQLFSRYKIAVGSTGNLGLSIGIMSAKLGFDVTVHMSADAKQWKKDRLRQEGVTVVEYADDYSKAVEEGRRQAATDPTCHFVDDENSVDLFLGYAVAGERVAAQLRQRGTKVDADHPLFVYLPCGVGGGPGGVAYGLKLEFGDHVHCFFAEPTHSPSMLLGMMTQLHDRVSVAHIGLDNKTFADGLAVGIPSGFVGKVMEPLLAGCFTVEDQTMFNLLRLLVDTEQLRLEPSALAGMTGPIHLLQQRWKDAQLPTATHLVWATGGSMVPKEEMESYYERGKVLKKQ